MSAEREQGCPFCDERGARREVHLHMVEEHPERVESWTDARRERMRYRIECPTCGEGYEHSVKPRSHDAAFLDTFAREIRMVAFDMLLNHIEVEHGPGSAAEGVPGVPEARGQQASGRAVSGFGPGGGRGRPGHGGLPLPPGMDLPPAPGIPGHPRPGGEDDEPAAIAAHDRGGAARWRP